MALHISQFDLEDKAFPVVGRIPTIPGRDQIMISNCRIENLSMYLVHGINDVIFKSSDANGWQVLGNNLFGPGKTVFTLTVLVPPDYDGEILVTETARFSDGRY